MGADERVVDRVGRRVLLEARPLRQQVDQQHAERGAGVLLAGRHNALVAEPRVGHAHRVLPAQAVDGDAVAAFALHEPAADDVVLGRLDHVGGGGLDDLGGPPGPRVGHRPTSSPAATFWNSSSKTRLGIQWNTVPRPGTGVSRAASPATKRIRVCFIRGMAASVRSPEASQAMSCVAATNVFFVFRPHWSSDVNALRLL